ncbi:MAG: DNA polymerase Y family protein, partial [Candidatus Krumholzibacteria bacterium]|nr:DNA polymerase Y family protein [Candidatus Krumholzibacteria bacterium]
MDRMACVNLPAFPLQLLIQRHADWTKLPVAVVDKDKPQGIILWVNKRAQRSCILPGMRYAKGLSLSPDLRAGVVSQADIQTQIDTLTERLRFFTPDVEPSKDQPGIFWLGASGLSLLYPSLKKWAGLIGSELSQAGYHCKVAVGFSRYAAYAIATSQKQVTVFENPDQERTQARAVAIVRLGFPPDLRDALCQLGIVTLGGFVDLPEDGIRKRFGSEAYDLYKLAKGELFSPLASQVPDEPFMATLSFDHPESGVERLMLVIDGLLDTILDSLKKKSRLLSAITMSFVLDNGDKKSEHLRPASPTIEVTEILKLIELRLHTISLSCGVVDIVLQADSVLTNHRQLELFAKKPHRDLKAAERAFAQLRAEFGERAVMRARLRDGHLPEACYEWEPMEKLSLPTPRHVKARNLVRRIFARSVALFSWSRHPGETPSWPRHPGETPSQTFTARHKTQGNLPGGRRPGIDGPDTIGPYIV